MSIPKLFAACKQGNVANVRHAMEDGIDVHIQSTHHLARRITTRDNVSKCIFLNELLFISEMYIRIECLLCYTHARAGG